MAFGNSGGQHRLMSEINVTPMVDVMLVLLVIFMVTAPMLMHGVDVDVPKATATPIEMKKEHLVVAIDSKRRVFIGKRQVTLPQLGAVLSARRDTRVFFTRRPRRSLRRGGSGDGGYQPGGREKIGHGH